MQARRLLLCDGWPSAIRTRSGMSDQYPLRALNASLRPAKRLQQTRRVLSCIVPCCMHGVRYIRRPLYCCVCFCNRGLLRQQNAWHAINRSHCCHGGWSRSVHPDCNVPVGTTNGVVIGYIVCRTWTDRPATALGRGLLVRPSVAATSTRRWLRVRRKTLSQWVVCGPHSAASAARWSRRMLASCTLYASHTRRVYRTRKVPDVVEPCRLYLPCLGH
jgi:hypothetical protein